MNIAVIGLGLIGGSLARAISARTEHTVFGHDINGEVIGRAVESGAIRQPLTPETLHFCDIIVIALYPRAAVAWLNENAPFIREGVIVSDCCGVKGFVCESARKIAERYGFAFIGGHPMAGRQFSGFDHADESLFDGASMILVPGECVPEKLETLERLYIETGFGRVAYTTAGEHDKVIAFSSQLAHVVSNAFVKSPAAERHAGFSAGSYRDLTRVAYLNEYMWAELFTLNAGALTAEIDFLINSLGEYRDAIASGDEQGLRSLLRKGKERKKALDG